MGGFEDDAEAQANLRVEGTAGGERNKGESEKSAHPE